MRQLWIGFSLTVLSLFFLAGAAQAQDAKTLFLAGQEAYQQGDYDKAIANWNAAYAKDPKPLIQYNLGGAFERVGRIDAAVAAFDKYLATAPDDDRVRRAEVGAKIERLRARLRETGLVVEGAPDGTSIDIDGKSWGLTPRPDAISLQPGSHTVTLKRDGYEPFTAMVAIGAGERVTVSAQMKALPEEAVAAAATDAGDPVVLTETKESAFPVVPVVLMAGGGAVFAGGLVVGLLASGKASDAKTDNDSDAKSAKSLALVSDIVMGVGIAAAAVGVVLLLVGGDDDETATATEQAGLRVMPLLGPSAAGASAEYRF